MLIDDEAPRPEDGSGDTSVPADVAGAEDISAPADAAAAAGADPERRRFLSNVSRAAMTAGLLGGYGGLGLVAGRYLYPARPSDRIWQYVVELGRMEVGASRLFRAPSGESINIVRQGSIGDATDFIALSSTCPHLGCQVYWESQNNRYFCPCHNGTFDPSGNATGGPPAEAGQSLGRYPLRVEGGLLFIEVPAARLIGERRRGQTVSDERHAISKPGHDRRLETGIRSGGDKKA
jgi:nitrite reductase/ring-hydroxylating ferredoxin subunit